MVTITNNGRLMIWFGKNITHNDTKSIIIHTMFLNWIHLTLQSGHYRV